MITVNLSPFAITPLARREACLAGEDRVRSFDRAPADFNLWEEEEAQQLHLLRSNLIVDCRFRRKQAKMVEHGAY